MTEPLMQVNLLVTVFPLYCSH